jgi:hypothetical protein
MTRAGDDHARRLFGRDARKLLPAGPDLDASVGAAVQALRGGEAGKQLPAAVLLCRLRWAAGAGSLPDVCEHEA